VSKLVPFPVYPERGKVGKEKSSMEEEDEKKGIVWENIDRDESVDHLVGCGS
jgi:hypothetical protein